MLLEYRKSETTTIIAGDINITSWKKGYEEWKEENDLWLLTNPNTPTFKKGTTTDAILIALGNYIPEGILPTEIEQENENQIQDYYPAYITKEPTHGEHMALILNFQTIRPDIRTEITKYNIHGFNNKEWAKRNAKLANLITEDKEYVSSGVAILADLDAKCQGKR